MNQGGFSLRALRGSSVVKYGLTNLIPRTAAILSTLVITPLAIQKLGVLEYGLWALATLVPNLLTSPDLGITNGVINELARTQREEGNLRRERERLLGLFRLLGLIALAWLVLGAVGLAWYSIGGMGGDMPPAHVYSALLLGLFIYVLGIPPTLWTKAQLALERGHEALAWEGAGKVMAFLAAVLVLLFTPNLYLLIVVTMLPPVLAAYWNGLRFERSTLPAGERQVRRTVRESIRENRKVFSAGRYFLLAQVAFVLGSAVDPFMIKSVLGTREAAYWSLARRPFEVLPLVVTLFSSALWPVFFRFNAANQVRQVKKLLLTIGGGSVMFLALTSAVILLLAQPLYAYLGGGKVQVNSMDLIWIALIISSGTLVIICNNYLSAVDLIRKQAQVQFGAALLAIMAKFISLEFSGLSAYFLTAALVHVAASLLPMLWLTWSHLRQREREVAQAA